MDYQRIRAERQAELDAALGRDIRAEEARLSNRLKKLLSEIDGAKSIISQYQKQIQDAEAVAQALQAQLAELERQRLELQSDERHWRQHAS